MPNHEIREGPPRFIQSRQKIWIEASLGNAEYNYLGCDPLRETLRYTSFPSECDLWRVERADGLGNVKHGTIRSGDHLILKSTSVHEFLSFRNPGSWHLFGDAGKNELWPVLHRVETWSNASGRYIGFFDHQERCTPIQSGTTVYFLPVYRGCIWLADHFRETDTVLRIFNADLCGTGLAIENNLRAPVKVVTESTGKFIQSVVNVPPGESFFIYPLENKSLMYLKHYAHLPRANGNEHLVAALSFPATDRPGLIHLLEDGKFDVLHQT